MLGRMPVPAAALLVVAALLGGCASGKVKEANDYVDAVNKAQTSFAATSERLLTKITPGSSGATDRATLRTFYAAVDSFVARLRRIKPPVRVTALHAKLIAAMQSFGTNLRAAGAAIVSGNATRILDGQQRLAAATSNVSRTINTTVSAINAALHG
jgi:hypothetical protein